MHIDACKEFYVNLTMFHYKKLEVARSRVRGVDIEFDSIKLASILGVPGNTGIFEVEEPATEAPAVPVFPASPGDSTNVQKESATIGVDPSVPTGSIPDSVFSLLQADFEWARANRIQADLERTQAENARLLSLLQQAQSQYKP
ncbi:hypothetical protein Dimus_000770 [Dionaea muscipula]